MVNRRTTGMGRHEKRFSPGPISFSDNLPCLDTK
jgi:hypothetical protein